MIKLFLILFSINAQALIIYQDGKPIKSYDRKKFLNIGEVKKVRFYNYNNNKYSSFIGISIKEIMKDAGIESKDIEEVVFNCLNGYTPYLNYQLFKNRDAILTYKSAGAAKFTRFSQKTKKIIELGPYYLVWKLDDLHFSQRKKYSSIYKVQAIDFRTKLFTLPFDTNQNIDGFDTYKRYCISCHQITNRGGTLSGDLLKSKLLNNKISFVNYVSNPQTVNPETQMLPFPQFSNRISKINNIFKMLNLLRQSNLDKKDLNESDVKDIKDLIKEFTRQKILPSLPRND